MSEAAYQRVADIAEVAPGSVKAVVVEGRSILLCHSDGRIFAIENQCSHAQEPLECGRLKAGWIACPAHGARFDLETGEALGYPATEPIRVFPVRIEGGSILVAL